MRAATARQARAGPGDTTRRWFPLIPRDKPPCPPLPERIARVRSLAHAASCGDDEPLTRAAQAHNLAALILSDCGIPAQARDLCLRQARLFAGTGPLDLPTAKLALQPLINMGRLLTRDGNGDAAYQHFQALFQAAHAQTEITINDITVRFRDLTASASDHRELTQWLWTILLSDGSRALAAAGRWTDAANQAQQHHGIGQRLLDGRQTLILAYCENTDYAAARSTLQSTSTPTHWEQAVAACLDALCLAWAGHPASAAAVTQATERYLALEPAPHPAIFHARLGLAVIDSCLASHHRTAITGIGQLVSERAVEARDAYVAYDVTTHPAAQASTTPAVRQTLKDIIQAAALRRL